MCVCVCVCVVSLCVRRYTCVSSGGCELWDAIVLHNVWVGIYIQAAWSSRLLLIMNGNEHVVCVSDHNHLHWPSLIELKP